MRRQPVCRPLSCLAATCLGGFLASGPQARGDITSANWVNNTLFNYRVTHMPDLDQKRDDLLDAFGVDCNGSIHCVPTCATNMVTYAANHGFPGVTPGPGFWEGQGLYALATNTIEDMGEDMLTNCATGGTSGDNANAALIAWLASEPGLVVNDHLSIGNFSPTHTSIGQSLCAGRIGSVSYGRYDVIGDFKGIPLVQRNGGHCTTAVKVRRNGATRELWVRDPAGDEGDLTMQSPFINTIWTVTDLTVIVMPDIDMKVMTAINYDPTDDVIRLIDGHRTITPAQGYSWDSSLGAIVHLLPGDFLNPTAPPVAPFPSPTGTAVLRLDWQDLTGEILVVCQGPSVPTLQALNPATGASHPIPTPISPAYIAVGRSDNVYICPGNAITRILYPAPPSPPPPPTPVSLPFVSHAMVYDDDRDDLALVSRTDRKLMRIDDSLTGAISVRDIPTAVPMGTRIQIAIRPGEVGVVYFWTDTSNSIWRLAPSGTAIVATPLSLPAAPLPRSLDFDDRGHMFVSNNGALVEFSQNSTGLWQVVPTSKFAGLPADRNFRMTRSRTNFTPGVHDTPAWTTNIDPALLPTFPSAPECAGDIAPNLNTDNIVDVNDLLMIITNWGPCQSAIRCVSDIDESGATEVNDLLKVITTWGACP